MRFIKSKNNFKLKITTIAILVVVLFCGTILSNASSFKNTKKTSIATKGQVEFDITNRHSFISSNRSGVLKIKRDLYETEVPMGKQDTWTILMYVTGSNLESAYANASSDFQEMFAANINNDNIKNFNLIIQTGGSRKWHSNNISSDRIGRYKLDNSQQFTLVDEQPLANMGSPDTLCEFLEWGIKNYPAEHMAVVFWNHGSGVENGVCQDSLFNKDPLSVNEMEFAFARTRKYMTSPYEFIGFDTCLSGSLEYANIFAPYARYMVASADLEPNEGWNYTNLVNSILNNPDINGYDLGKAICDSYADFYNNLDSRMSNQATMSLYDLSKVDDVCIETNYLTKYMYDKLLSNDEYYYTFSNNLRKCTKYSESTIDIGSLLTYFDNSSEFDYNTYYYRQAIDKFIAYSRIGSYYANQNCLGLTLYCPDSTLSLWDLENARNTVFSPFWLKFIERMSYRRVNKTYDNYHTIDWETNHWFYENTFNFLNYSDYKSSSDWSVYSKLQDNDDYQISGFPLCWYDNFKNDNNYGASTFVVPSYGGFMPLPMFKNTDFNINNNTINAKIDLNIENLNEIANVYNSLLLHTEDSIICLGENNKLTYNTESNEASTSFTGEWFMLPDGQYLTTYIISEENDATIYGIPVYIEDTESTIRIEETKNYDGSYSYTVLGVWDATNTSGHAGRGYLPLTLGTTIIPIYDTYNVKDNKYETEYGEEYTIRSNFDFMLGKLSDGKYSYSFNIQAANGYNYLVDLKDFTVTNSIIQHN